MFGWFFKLFQKEDVDYYKPKERLLYKYFDGQKKVLADPMVLYRRMVEKGTELSLDMQVADSMSKDRFKARIAVIKKINDIFSIKGQNEGGLTEAESEGLLTHFINWCDELKKKSSPSPTSQDVVSKPTKTMLEESPIIENSLGSGLPEIEINSERPLS